MKRFFLIDCNNFFVSCERLFNPSLVAKPVVILSSNDGCIISRSNEAKALGIPMGAPVFEWKAVFKKHNVAIYSSNFSLYSDLSTRVMQTVAEHASDVEIYSIDEAFFHCADLANQSPAFYANTARALLYKVKKHTGIPVTIGIGPTKTLAKMATKIAKKQVQYGGVLDLSDWSSDVLDEVLKTIPVGDIWGIGRKSAAFLAQHFITTAYDLKYAQDAWIQKYLKVTGLRTVHELRGISCFSVDTMPQSKKSVIVSRSFGSPITQKEHLHQAIATHAAKAARQLRGQKTRATSINVFLIAGRHHDATRQYIAAYKEFSHASSYTPDFIAAAKECIDQLFVPGTIYKKAGVMINDIVQEDAVQLQWFEQMPAVGKQDNMMHTLDGINRRWGSQQLVYAATTGRDQPWRMKQLSKSPCFTTNWHEILRVKV